MPCDWLVNRPGFPLPYDKRDRKCGHYSDTVIQTKCLPAGDAKVYERILDYNKIVEALALPKGLPDTNPYRSTSCKEVVFKLRAVVWVPAKLQ